MEHLQTEKCRSKQPGVRLPPFLQCLKQILIERSVEVIGNDETALVDPEYGASLLYRQETCDGSARAGDDDLLSGNRMPQQTGEMGLRFVDADLTHGELKVD